MEATIPLIEISGSARERGRQYGEAAREQIHRSIAFYSQSFTRNSGLTWDEVRANAPQWVPYIERYLPDAVEEVRGIAEGANCTFAEILALNGRGELTYGNPFTTSTEGCTSYAITDEGSGDGHVYCGQNWDWRSSIQDTVVILRIREEGKPTITTQVEAGQVGRHGANAAGIALNANGLGGQFGQRLGVPGPYIRRKVLSAWNMNDALRAIFKVEQSFTTNLLVTHRDGFAIDIETTPARHGWLYPTDGLIVHANHFDGFVPEQIADSYRPFAVSSLYRQPRVERVLKHARKATTPEAMRALIATALRDHFSYPVSVCSHGDPRKDAIDHSQTIMSSIVDLTAGEYYITHGPPCQSEYQRLPWNIYDDTTPDRMDSATLADSLAAFAHADD